MAVFGKDAANITSFSAKDCRFEENQAGTDAGGVVFQFYSTGCTFVDNVAGECAGGVSLIGSGPDFQTNAAVINCEFRTNRSRFYGGGMNVSRWAKGTVAACRFIENTSSNGGGLSCAGRNWNEAQLKLTGCTFSQNTAQNDPDAAFGLTAVDDQTLRDNGLTDPARYSGGR